MLVLSIIYVIWMYGTCKILNLKQRFCLCLDMGQANGRKTNETICDRAV